MISKLSTRSVRSLSRGLMGLAVVSGVIFSAAAVQSLRLIGEAQSDWSSYQQINAAYVRATGEVIDALGYGGMIHEFKNYVIRKDEARIQKVQIRAGAALGALQRLEALGGSPEKLAAIESVRNVVVTYLKQLKTAQSVATFNSPAVEIDKTVKVDDGPALEGLSLLVQTAKSGVQVDGKSKHVSDLRLALGYGGMIHQFKNYVLRQDAPRIAKVEAGLSRARQSLQAYEALGVTSEEAAALSDIAGVLDAYEAGLRKVRELAAGGATVEEIDAQVKVDDGPALRGLTTLDLALGRESAQATERLTNDLFIAQRINLLIALVTVALSGFLALSIYVVMTRGVARPAERIAGEVRKLADGDLDVSVSELEADTEIGAIARAAGVFRDNLAENRRMAEERAADEQAQAERRAMQDDLQTRLRSIVEAALAGDYTRRVDHRYGDADLDALAEQISQLLGSVEHGVAEAGRVVGELSSGDLSARMSGFDTGAFGALQSNINATMERLERLVRDIQSSAQDTARGGAEIENGAQQLSSSAESQAAALEETSATMEEMSASIKSNADNATQAENAAREAASRASRGSEVVAEAVGAVERIEESSGKISDIISVIESIAFQTNLLALNAAVEAARAGDAGKGFAVVASEVRTLAQRSSEAAKDITALIHDSSTHVADGVGLVRSTGDALAEINAAIDNVVSNIDGISAASREQASGVSEISAAITHMDSSTQKNAGLANESALNAKRLAQGSKSLRELVSYFRTGDAGAADAGDWGGEGARRSA